MYKDCHAPPVLMFCRRKVVFSFLGCRYKIEAEFERAGQNEGTVSLYTWNNTGHPVDGRGTGHDP